MALHIFLWLHFIVRRALFEVYGLHMKKEEKKERTEQQYLLCPDVSVYIETNAFSSPALFSKVSQFDISGKFLPADARSTLFL